MSAPARVLLVGAGGRMGHAIAVAAAKDPSLTIAARAERGDALEPLLRGCDVVIDFSLPEGTEAVCRACAEDQRPLILGTTGQTAAQKEAVRTAAGRTAIVFASNFSLGVNALFALARQAAALLGAEFDLEIVEAHHRAKEDAPSGTAKRLAEILEETRGSKSSVPIHSVRAGDIVGDHQVIFAGSGERLELTHRASSRETFARGALHAARWVIGKPAGLYSMEDVLG
ncbi:MAG: 4-hydroxy-tetrahydrodipicolinate reductase [Chthoniobacterales bacterium]|nr:4-hydroxy-tetrahydrodipicolinate reductase [Chthoniobacterales bacterium]